MSSSAWVEVKLEEIINIEMGQSPKSEFYNTEGKGLPFLQGNRTFGDKYPTFDTFCTDIKRKANQGDVIMSVRAPVGDLNIATENICIGRGVCAMNMKNHNNMYLFYLLKQNIKKLINRESGTIFGSVNKNDICGLEVLYTSNEREQSEIAATISCVDEKIDINKRINKNLEDMAQTIFKNWFVDFEPFQEGEFEESEFGRIPKGWRVTKIEDVTKESNTGGDAIQKTPMVDYDTGIKCVRVGDLSNQRNIDGWGYSNVNEENFRKYQLKKNDIVVTRTATLGLNQIIDEDLMAVYNNGLIRIKLNDKVVPLFFYQTINTDKYKEYIGCIESESSTRPNMKMNYLLSYKFICPPIEIQEEFVDIIERLRQQRLNLYKQTNILTTIRDSILPKLMKGEIRIPLEEVQ
jgi:type I restriction enzyme S subunit